MAIIDNLHNAHEEAFNRVTRLAGKELAAKVAYEPLDIKDSEALKRLFATHKFDVRLWASVLRLV